ncbi:MULTISPECIES: hypothetical protein [unclassified Halorubrum]|uniref:hypothetical protein n=1 Tax=unclassified Halorubrum TaxID=2642239 RepID=UPI0010F58FB5|nr:MULTISPECIES: hypothetical protein [unclassified Halorubrum]TKX52600.1 hypothetical protein EXE42_15920 [Halorubrum sp. SP3]
MSNDTPTETMEVEGTYRLKNLTGREAQMAAAFVHGLRVGEQRASVPRSMVHPTKEDGGGSEDRPEGFEMEDLTE